MVFANQLAKLQKDIKKTVIQLRKVPQHMWKIYLCTVLCLGMSDCVKCGIDYNVYHNIIDLM